MRSKRGSLWLCDEEIKGICGYWSNCKRTSIIRPRLDPTKANVALVELALGRFERDNAL